MKKISALSLLFVTSIMSLAGCGGSGNKTDYDPNNFLPNGTDENPYQIVAEPVTIEIFAPKSAGNPPYEDLKMFKHLSKITNLNFKFTTPDSSAYTTVRSGVWQSGEIPDLFLFNNSTSELVQFAEEKFNAYVPLNDDNYSIDVNGTKLEVGNVIKNYMKNYSHGLDTNFGFDRDTQGDAVKISTLSDGNIYCTLSVKDVARDLTYKMFVNQNWIDNLNNNYDLGLKNANELETLEDYYDILKAFYDYDANDNGDPNDEIPVTSKALEYLRNYILQSYGYVSYGPEIKDDWSTFEYVPLTDAYREYLKFANKLYSEGLLHKNTFSLKTDAQIATYGQQNLLGSFVAAAPYIITGYDYESQYTTIPPVRANGYEGPLRQIGFGNLIPGGACIPQKSVYVREVARLIDIMYSDLGAQLISYGVEGEDWHWDDDAHSTWTFDVPENWDGNQEQYRATITPNVNSGSALYWNNNFVGKMNDEIIMKLNEQSSIYVPYLKVPEPYEVKLSSSEYAQVSKIKASLDKQLEYLESCFVKGTDGCDPFDDDSYTSNFIRKIKGFNCEDLLTCYNNALARYKGE